MFKVPVCLSLGDKEQLTLECYCKPNGAEITDCKSATTSASGDQDVKRSAGLENVRSVHLVTPVLARCV